MRKPPRIQGRKSRWRKSQEPGPNASRPRPPGIAAHAKGQTLVRSCRVCGCTDRDCRGCVLRTGAPCSWVAKDLCSACVLL